MDYDAEKSKTMGKRDNMYTLEGAVEFDEGYFEKATSEKVKLKRGWGSQPQANVSVMAESTPLEDVETGKKVIIVDILKWKYLKLT